MSLSIRNLTVQFGGVRPLDDVTLDFAPGLSGLVGPNGAGKTTLFNVLSGFVTPVAGEALLDGVDLLRFPPHRRARAGVRRTFQQEQIVGSLSVLANIQVAADHLGTADPRHLLDFVGLGHPHRPASELTLFERRRLELARTLAGTPRVLLLDEPGAGLSLAESTELGSLYRRVADEFGTTVVLIEHDMELVGSVCSWLAVLDFGRLIAVGETREVLTDDRVRRAYLGTEEVA